MRHFRLATWLSGLLLAFNAGAADVPFVFEDDTDAERYQRLVEELRCLVCQNQSLADSHADLAQDLRDEIYRMIGDGLSDEEIVGFLVDRYGDFVLYRPPLKASTVLLWFGPFLIFIAAVFIAVRFLRRQAARMDADGQAAATEAEGERP